MRTNRLILSALCGGFLSATRPLGVMFSLPFLGHQLLHTKFTVKSIIKIIILSLLVTYKYVITQHHVIITKLLHTDVYPILYSTKGYRL